MVKVNEIVKANALTEDQIEREVSAILTGGGEEDITKVYENSVKNFEPHSLLKGRIINRVGDDVVVDVGYKSEGIISINEFSDPAEAKVGCDVEVLLEEVEDETGLVILSKRKADRMRNWERIISTCKEGDTVRGKVTRKIKGGLLLDIGVPVFLPASQIGIRRAADTGEFLGRELECKIVKIDEPRMNIVVSRRRLLEEQRESMKQKLLTEIEDGQIREGIVKNIADFGAFIDLGGIDGLLHITDMSWGRINHPSEMLKLDEKVEVMVLKVDREKERIALGLKQKTDSPWKKVEDKYPVGTKIKGSVVNVMSYGAFVKLEDGIEGLVHISEMSWTKRLNHPSEMVNPGNPVDVVVLAINRDKQEISLGMKQAEVNPWTLVEEKYPPGTKISGKVRNLTNYGAFVEIEEGIDGLLHVSDMSWTKKVANPQEMIKKGDVIEAMVLSVDQEKKRVALGMKQLKEDPWLHAIPEKFKVGATTEGVVTKLTSFGVFVELESDLEGLLHVSEMASGQKNSVPQDLVKPGEKLEVEIIKVDPSERKIGLKFLNKLGPVDPVPGASATTGAAS